MNLKQILYLPFVLRSVAVLVLGAVTLRYFVDGNVQLPPIVIIVLLTVISFSYHRWPRTCMVVSLSLAVLIPVSVLFGYLEGNAELALLLFDGTIFSWVIVSVINTYRLQSDGAA